MCLLQEKKCCLILLIRTMQCRSNYLDHLTGDFEGSVEERMAYFLQKAQGFSDFLSFFFSFTLFYFTILYWFCHTSTWILHGCTRVPHPEPPSCLPPHTISLGHPSAPASPTVLLGFLLPWTWGISSRLLQQSTAAAPYLGWRLSPHSCPSWPWTWSSSSRPFCASTATTPMVVLFLLF